MTRWKRGVNRTITSASLHRPQGQSLWGQGQRRQRRQRQDDKGDRGKDVGRLWEMVGDVGRCWETGREWLRMAKERHGATKHWQSMTTCYNMLQIVATPHEMMIFWWNSEDSYGASVASHQTQSMRTYGKHCAQIRLARNERRTFVPLATGVNCYLEQTKSLQYRWVNTHAGNRWDLSKVNQVNHWFVILNAK